MTTEDTPKEYSNGETTILWKPWLCIHSGVCVKNLPGVFRPRERPWIHMAESDSFQIEAAVRKCPSGALSLKES